MQDYSEPGKTGLPNPLFKNKIDTLGSLFWLLEQAISHKDDEKIEQIMTAIKLVHPCNLSDDYMLKLQVTDEYSAQK
jgi:hypothetical protein